MGFYEKYIETVTKNDSRTRNSVDAIIGRMLYHNAEERCNMGSQLPELHQSQAVRGAKNA